MSNFPFGELPSGCPIHLSCHWTSTVFGARELIYTKLLLEISAGTLPAITVLIWAGIAPSWPNFYTWPAFGQWITKRQMGFERDAFPFGCWGSGYTACPAEFWLISGLMAPSSCSFVQVTTQIFLLLTVQLKTSWRFYNGLSKKESRIIEEFDIEILNWSLLGLETQKFIGTRHIMQKKKES